MSDLISRSALISHIVRKYWKYGAEYNAKQIWKDIEDFPTAFDLDKVIAELEQKRIEIKDKLLNSFDEGLSDMLRGKLSQIADDIELIKTSLTPSEPPKTD